MPVNNGLYMSANATNIKNITSPNIGASWTETETNSRHFPEYICKWIFFKENIWILVKISLNVVPKGSNQQYSSLGSNKGIAPPKRQAIIWTNGGWLTDSYMHHCALMS